MQDIIEKWKLEGPKWSNLRDFLKKRKLTLPKRRNSARCLQKDRQDQKRSNSARPLQKWKVECKTDGLAPMRFAIFPLHLSTVLRLPRKSEARSHKVLHLSSKTFLGNLAIWCSISKMQRFSENQRPGLLKKRFGSTFYKELKNENHQRQT